MSTDVPGIGAFEHRNAGRITLVAVMTAVWLGWAAMLIGVWSPEADDCQSACHCHSDETPAVELLK